MLATTRAELWWYTERTEGICAGFERRSESVEVYWVDVVDGARGI